MPLSTIQTEALKDRTGTMKSLECIVETIQENTGGETPTGTMTYNGVEFPTYTVPCYECTGTATNVAPWDLSIERALAVAECQDCSESH